MMIRQLLAASVRRILFAAGLALAAWGAFASVTPQGGGSSGGATARVVAAAAAVREPWDGVIDIDFTVYLPLSGTVASIGVSAVDGARTFTASALAGVTAVATSGTYRVSWDFAADYPDVYAPQLTVTVGAAVVSFTPDAESGSYLVVDLAGGADAARYPVSYLTEVPAGGWTDVYKTEKLVLRKIPAGSFTMGTREGDYPNAPSSGLREVVFTNAVWAGVFEVTQRQWELVKGSRPSYFKNETCYETRPVERVNYEALRGKANGALWPASGEVDADSFFGVLRERTGDSTFDLPTEAQWEYACRAGRETALNCGSNLVNRVSDPVLDTVARYGFGSVAPSSTWGLEKGTAAVGSFLPNDWGLYDCHGNVWEWTLDWYEDALGTTTATNPPGPASSRANTRILRGGGWNAEARECSAGWRSKTAGAKVSSNSSAFGFRVFATVPAAPTWEGPTTGSGVAAPVAYDGRIIITLPVALDQPSLTFTTGGDNGAVWFATNDYVKVGTHATRCLSPGQGTRTNPIRSVWMETTVTGAGTVAFWWKVDCDYDLTGACDWDRLMYFVDGVEQGRIDGDTDWTLCTVELASEGEHTIRWVYQKDNYADERDCADTAWVDGLVWTPAGRDDEPITATITISSDGRILIGWLPREADDRTPPCAYTLLAKHALADPDWIPVAESTGRAPFVAPAGYRFFKVSTSR